MFYLPEEADITTFTKCENGQRLGGVASGRCRREAATGQWLHAVWFLTREVMSRSQGLTWKAKGTGNDSTVPFQRTFDLHRAEHGLVALPPLAEAGSQAGSCCCCPSSPNCAGRRESG